MQRTARSLIRAYWPWNRRCRSGWTSHRGVGLSDFPGGEAGRRLYGSQVAALFNQVQLAETGADFSCTSLGNDPVGLASPVTMRGVTAAIFLPTLWWYWR